MGASTLAENSPDNYSALPIAYQRIHKITEALDIADIRNAVQSLMWRMVGVQRHEKRLNEALHDIRSYARYVLPHAFSSEEGWELQNLLTVSHLMAEAALARSESRGVHMRTDFPSTDDGHWRQYVNFKFQDQLPD